MVPGLGPPLEPRGLGGLESTPSIYALTSRNEDQNDLQLECLKTTFGATGLTVDYNGTDTGTARWTIGANLKQPSHPPNYRRPHVYKALPGSLSASGSGS